MHKSDYAKYYFAKIKKSIGDKMFNILKSLFNKKTFKNQNVEDFNKNVRHLQRYLKSVDTKDKNTIVKNDYLALAANAGHQAYKAIKNKQFDEAWRLLHEQKGYYFSHSKKYNWTMKQHILLEATIHCSFADILRLEGKHEQALIEYIFCVAGEYPVVAYKAKKLKAYFNRAKLNHVSFREVEDFIYNIQDLPEYLVIKDKVKEWIDRN